MFRRASRVLSASFRLSATLALVALLFTSGAAAAEPPSVAAQYAVVVDADTGTVLFDKSMDTPAAPASLTKIFTSIYALSAAPLDRQITVDQADLVGESSMGLSAGDTVTLKTALYGMLLPSGNDAAMTVAQNLGAQPGDSPQQAVDRYVGWLNDMAARLGLTHTHLMNPHGLDQDGHVTTARDLAAITIYALKDPTFRQIIGSSSYSGDGFELRQVNRLLGSYPGLIGGKTGITDNAGYCLVEVAERDGHTIVAVVMKSTATDWYDDATTLLDFGFSAVESGQAAEGVPAITLAPVVIQPGLEKAAPPQAAVTTPQASSTQTSIPSESQLAVRHESDNVAVVSHNLPSARAAGFSWKWPIASLITMLGMLAIALNYQLVIGAGSLLLRHRSTGRVAVPAFAVPAGSAPPATPRRRERPRRSQRRNRSIEPAYARVVMPEPAPVVPPSPILPPVPIPPVGIVALNAAETIGTRGVRLALRGDYHAAASEFTRALRSDSTFDLTRCAGFWGMQPAGYVAAARAYALIDRTADAKSLLTVIKLSCGTHRELESLLNQVVEPVKS